MTDLEGPGRANDPVDAIDADGLVALLRRTRDAFASHREEIDALNVFPVPDGDTGTNLLATVDGVLAELDRGARDRPDTIVRAALRAARGNSGVIFSQVLRGLAERVAEDARLGPAGLAGALEAGRRHAYAAVADPVEGTMLTAVRVAADTAAERVAGEDRDLAACSEAVVDAVAAAVERTVDQLDALREAGVVDAGARGMEVFCRELHGLVAGLPPHHVPAPVVRRDGVTARRREAGSSTFRYEVQYLLDGSADAADALREQLTTLGDSVVVVAAGELVNVHVHTNEIGAAIEVGLEHGRPSRIQVVRFTDQVREREAAARRGPAVADLGVVAVVPGPGLVELVEHAGGVAIEGGPGALPAVADVLNAVAAVSARRVAILPGHPNVVPAARQAVEVAVAEGGRPLEVLEAVDSAPAVLAALAVLSPAGDPERLLDEMRVAARSCRTAAVVPAVRDADTPVGPVRRGQHLVTHGGQVVAVTDDPVEALRRAFQADDGGATELVTLIVGNAPDDDERAAAVATAREAAAGADVEVVDGGQSSSRYLLGFE